MTTMDNATLLECHFEADRIAVRLAERELDHARERLARTEDALRLERGQGEYAEKWLAKVDGKPFPDRPSETPDGRRCPGCGHAVRQQAGTCGLCTNCGSTTGGCS